MFVLMVKLSPVCILLIHACVVWGFDRKFCFKEIAEDGTCKYESFVRHSNRDDIDCCNRDEAAYYVNNVNRLKRIGFFIFRLPMRNCLPCTGSGQTTQRPPSCMTKRCHGRKVCQIKNNKAKCVCPSCNTLRLRTLQPVCGTDGKTYKNECEFRRSTCKHGTSDIEVAYNGSCQTGGCDNVVCRKKRTCVVDLYNVPSCVDCSMFHCSKVSKNGGPICGANGVQYASQCHLRLESCRQGKTIGLAYKGNCIANATCHNTNCSKEKKHCVYDNNNKPRCVTCSCDDSFPDPLTELCGTDNKTYSDYCSLKAHMCLGNKFIDVQHRGPCIGHTVPDIQAIQRSLSCETKRCDGRKVCKMRVGRAKCVCPSCNTPKRLRTHAKVCGTDGKTYKSECEFRRLTCKHDRSDIKVAYNGSCQIGCDNVVCSKNRTCVVDLYNVPSCVDCAMIHCSKVSKNGGPICGANGVQYASQCHLRLESCRQGKTIGLGYEGNCIANATCHNINCSKEKKHCVYDNNNRPRCVTCSCGDSFPGPLTELCGTDNKTYTDYCSLKAHMCLENKFIDVQHGGPCRD